MAEASVPFMQAMYANQPAEGSTGLTDEEILGSPSGVGVDGHRLVRERRQVLGLRDGQTEKTPVQPGAAGIGTPTIVVNGEILTLTGDPEADLVTPLQG